MKSLNVKRVAALAAGAALLGSALVAAEVTYSNVQLVNQNGQPTAQVVVGSGAAASDGVVAANIAAMLGNLAYKAQTLTASTAGEATCSVGGGAASGGTCAISNEKVKLQVTLPGVVSGAYGWKTLIQDYSDKYLENRNSSTQEDLYNTTIDVSGFDVPTKSNYWAGLASNLNKIQYPVGTGGTPGQPARQAVKKVGANEFGTFATFNTKDSKSGKSYSETQTMWLYTETMWDDTLKKVVAKKPYIAYRAQFAQAGDTYGIPMCSALGSGAAGWWGSCTSSNASIYGSTTEDDRSDRHRISIKWLGEDWIISEMNLPDGTNSTIGGAKDVWINPAYNFSAGGSIKLAKESSYGFVNIGQNLSAGNYIVKLVDITVPSSTLPYGAAVLEIYDANGQKVYDTRIASGSTMTWTAPDGTPIKVKVYKATPGYTLSAKWAEMAVYAQEIELKDDERLDVDNTNWYAKILWKNKDYDTGGLNTNVDALWALEVYNTQDSLITTLKLDKGATYDVPKKNPVVQLQYDGLTLQESDYDSLIFSLVRDSIPTKDSSCTSGSDYDAGPLLLQVQSGLSNAFTIGGYTVSSFWIELPSRNASNTTAVQNAGTIFANTGSCYARLSTGLMNDSGGVTVQYNPGDGDQPINFWNAPIVGTTNEWVKVGIREDPGNNPAGKNPAASAYDYWNASIFGNTSTSGTYTFGTASGLKRINYTDVVYGGSNVVTGLGGTATEVDEQRISARGSKFESLTTTSLSLKMAKKVAEAQYYVKTTSATPNAPVEVTLAEGEEASLAGGVKIKVASITEDVGACSAAPGTASCTVDQSGVSAVLSTGGASVQASVPYMLATNSQPMVVLDSAAGSGTLISVGGPLVNSVTSRVLQGSDVPITASSPPTVKVVGTNIVVAGGSAADTVRAGNDFIAALKQS